MREYTKREKFRNWFYYNKLWVLVALVIAWVLGSMLWNLLGIGRKEPDYRFVYIGTRLPEDCVEALEAGLASLAEDCNGDGTVDGRDVSRLLRYLANRDPVTGKSDVVLGK